MKKGAKFENLVKESCNLQLIHCERLKDGSGTTLADGSIMRLKTSNPSDFIVYNGTTWLYLECKSYQSAIPFKDLRQLDLQLEKVNTFDYLNAGFIIEFKKVEKVVYLSCQQIEHLQILISKKSFNYKDVCDFAYKLNSFLPTKRSRKERVDIKSLMEYIKKERAN